MPAMVEQHVDNNAGKTTTVGFMSPLAARIAMADIGNNCTLEVLIAKVHIALVADSFSHSAFASPWHVNQTVCGITYKHVSRNIHHHGPHRRMIRWNLRNNRRSIGASNEKTAQSARLFRNSAYLTTNT